MRSRYEPRIDEVSYRWFGNRNHSCILIDSASFEEFGEINEEFLLTNPALLRDVNPPNDILERCCVVRARHIKSQQNWLFISWHAKRWIRNILNRNFFQYIQNVQTKFDTYKIVIGGDFNENLHGTTYHGAVVPEVDIFPA